MYKVRKHTPEIICLKIGMTKRQIRNLPEKSIDISATRSSLTGHLFLAISSYKIEGLA